MKCEIKKLSVYHARLIILFSLIAFFSCNKKDRNAERYYDKNVETFALQGIDIKMDTDMATRRIIGLRDSIMYIESLMDDTLISVYQLKNDSLVLSNRFLNGGRGPYEMGVYSSLHDKKTEPFLFLRTAEL